MTPDLDEITWVADRRPTTGEPDGVATDRARVALMEHISTEPARSRRRWLPWLAAAASGAAVAAAGGAVLTAGGRDDSAVRAPLADTQTHATHGGAAASGHVGRSHVVSGSPVLLHLAHTVARAPALPGNATLVVHHNVVHGAQGEQFSGDDLYEDNGDYFYGADLSELRQSVADPGGADPTEGKVINAAAGASNESAAQAAQALYAASPAPSAPGTLAEAKRTAVGKLKAAERAAPTAAARAALELKLSAVQNAPDVVTQAERDNYLWLNIGTALEGGAGRADVRAGALLAASQLPDVTVTSTTSDGQSVVQVTNGEFPDGYTETYDVDPQTGVLVHFRGGGAGDQDDSVDVTYQVSRVTTPSLDPAR
jgi:hypothetical protein